MIPTLTPQEIARFNEKVRRGDGCWLWPEETNNKGYGRFTIWRGPRRIRILTHRLAWLLATGEDPCTRVVRHDCDTPACCNPEHLRLGSQADNVQDAVERGRADLHGLAKFREKRLDAVRRRILKGEKRCSRCRVIKPFGAFHKSVDAADGHASRCKECVSILQRVRGEARRQQASEQRQARAEQCRRAAETRASGLTYAAIANELGWKHRNRAIYAVQRAIEMGLAPKDFAP